jgi:DNA-directed RNA polymerase omega subunit
MTSRLTSELAVDQIGNRFDLVLVASQRARELQNGSAPRVNGVHGKYIATALKEIEEGKYTMKEYISKLPGKQKKGHRDEYFPT